MSQGVSFVIASNTPLCKEILECAEKHDLNTYPNLAEQYQEIYTCLIYLNLVGVTNDTKSIMGPEKATASKIISINNTEFEIKYFYSDNLSIRSFRILKP
jgi:hypothetical protein